MLRDREKDREAEEERNRKESLVQLQNARMNRLTSEPDLSEPFETVMVRHVSLGTQSRLFKSGATFSEVYDWIGCLSLVPEFYELKEYNGNVIPPDSVVQSGSYNMNEAMAPVPMSPENIVAFRGFGSMEIDDEEVREHAVSEPGSITKPALDQVLEKRLRETF